MVHRLTVTDKWRDIIATPTNIEMGFLLQSVLREGYLKEMIQVLSDPRYGNSLTQVDATIKKHEAISADILARVCDVSF
jgi:hypothetical protein